MRRAGWILIGAIGVAATGTVVAQELYRRVLEHRLHQAVEARRQLELQFGEMVGNAEQLRQDLQREQQRSQGLSETLASTQLRLEDVSTRLAEATQNVRRLQTRLGDHEERLGELQGELAMALQEHQQTGPSDASHQVELDRVIVTSGETPVLQGHVVSVHREWNFVVLDMGWDTVRVGDTVSIFRDEHLLAKARIDRVQEGVCAATLLPEWAQAEVRINDLVRLL